MANVITIGVQWDSVFTSFAIYIVVGFLFLAILRAWRRRRKPQEYYGRTMGEPQSPDRQPDADEVPKKMTLGVRLFAICFFSIWLIIWTAGCYMAGRAWLGLSFGDEGFVFLLIWLTLAIPAWFVVAGLLIRLVRGDHVELSFDGDADGGD